MNFLFLSLFCWEQVYFSATFFLFYCLYATFLEMKGKHQVLVLSCGFTLEILYFYFSPIKMLPEFCLVACCMTRCSIWESHFNGKKEKEDSLLNEWVDKPVELKENDLFSLITNSSYYPPIKCISFFSETYARLLLLSLNKIKFYSFSSVNRKNI